MRFDQLHTLTLTGEEMRALKAALLQLPPDWKPSGFQSTYQIVLPVYDITKTELARVVIGRILLDAST